MQIIIRILCAMCAMWIQAVQADSPGHLPSVPSRVRHVAHLVVAAEHDGPPVVMPVQAAPPPVPESPTVVPSVLAAPVNAPPISTTPAALGITATQIAAWDRVNVCEEGGSWTVSGPVYSGGLGFSHANWTQFDTFGFPSTAALATPDEQIRVAVAFAEHYWGTPDAAPDQAGCGTGY